MEKKKTKTIELPVLNGRKRFYKNDIACIEFQDNWVTNHLDVILVMKNNKTHLLNITPRQAYSIIRILRDEKEK